MLIPARDQCAKEIGKESTHKCAYHTSTSEAPWGSSPVALLPVSPPEITTSLTFILARPLLFFIVLLLMYDLETIYGSVLRK